MFDPATLMAFLTASLAIVLAPGPAQTLTLARSLSDGKRSGIMTAVGLNVGTMVHTLAAALGLSAVLATSAIAFAVVKYLGAVYLVYLGIKALLTKEQETPAVDIARADPGPAFTKAVITGILNPKVALFFLAFLPQFVDARHGSVFWQFMLLGVILAVLDMGYESVLASVAGTLASWFTSKPKIAAWRQRMMGAVLVGLGIRLALTQRD
jgi:threonine/homoserine/homoserine lactone efflux protein